MGVYAGPANAFSNRTDSNRIDATTKLAMQSGLVLNLDAGASTSYVGSGTTWTDLSDKISTATGALPIYNTTDNGTFKTSGTRTDANASSLVLAIPMDGANNGTTFTDESATIKGSGTAKAITNNGSTQTLTAQSKFYGSSGFFNGSSQTLSIASSSDFGYGTGDFTWEGWFNSASFASGNNYLLDHGSNGGVIQYQGGVLRYYNPTIGVGGALYTTGFGSGLSTGRWYHFAAVRQSGITKLYLDGVLSVSAADSHNYATNNFTVGNYGGGGPYYWNGYLQDFRVYKGVAKYTTNFIPPIPNNGTLTNGPTYSSANGGSLVFDGSNDYVSGSIPTLTNWSITLWYRSTDITSKQVFYPFSGQAGANGLGFGGTFDASTNNRWYFFDGTNSSFSNSNTAVTTNIWYYLVVTKSSTTYNLYTNGSLSLSTTGSDLSLVQYNLGRRGDNQWYVNGQIAQASLYNRALSATEVSQNFNALRSRFGI